jgi:hypothetical protein
LYAGVEIGGKGIKLSVIKVKLNRTGESEYILKTDTSINTDAAALSYQSEKETTDAVSVFYSIITVHSLLEFTDPFGGLKTSKKGAAIT